MNFMKVDDFNIFRAGKRIFACILMIALLLITGEGYTSTGMGDGELKPSHYCYADRESGLMIESRCSQYGDYDHITYNLDFPGTPHVVASAQYGFDPKMAAAMNISSTGFDIAVRDHNGNAVDNAWVLWIAVYPHEYHDPDTGLTIETRCGVVGDGDSISYNQSFAGTPNVVSSAQYSGVAKMSCPVNHSASGFSIAIQDHDGNSVSDAWLQWIAVYPHNYVDPDSDLRIEANCGQRSHNDNVAYNVSFPGKPNVVTCAQYVWEPKMACPVNHTSGGFTLALRDHDGNDFSDAWTFYLAVYPTQYEEAEPQPSICLSPTSLVNSCYEGQDASAQSFEVWNCGDAVLNYSITCNETGGDWQPYGDRYAIIVMGGNVTGQMYVWYWGDTYGMYTELTDRGFTAENIQFLSYGPSADEHPEAVDGVSTTANIIAAYQWAEQNCTADDLLYIYWVDHGSPSYFVAHDGNITHSQLGNLMDPITAKQIIGGYNPCYSGGVIDDISDDDVITVTSQDASHPNSWGWAGKWRQSLRGGTDTDPSDTNDDGYISLTEAYEWIAPKSQAAGEHSMYDDNGDGSGSEWGTSAFDPDDPAKDGYKGNFYSLNGWIPAANSINREVDWMVCSPTSGTSSGEHDVIDVIYDTDQLAAGEYSAVITVSDPNADNNPQTINVSLTVQSVTATPTNTQQPSPTGTPTYTPTSVPPTWTPTLTPAPTEAPVPSMTPAGIILVVFLLGGMLSLSRKKLTHG